MYNSAVVKEKAKWLRSGHTFEYMLQYAPMSVKRSYEDNTFGSWSLHFYANLWRLSLLQSPIPPPPTQLQINQVPWSNMGVAEDIKQSLTWGIDSQNSLLWWNGVVIDKLQLYKSFQNLN